MDLHFTSAAATAAGASRGRCARSRVSAERRDRRGGTRAASSRCCRVLHAVQRPHRLDQPRCAQLRLRAPRRAAGRGVRRRHVLRALLDDAAPAARRARLRRHRLHVRGAAALCEARIRIRTAGRSLRGRGTTWLRSPCLGLCDRAPAALVTDGGRSPRARQLAPVDAAILSGAMSGASRRARVAARRRLARCGCCAASDASIPESLDAYRASGGYRRAATSDRRWAASESIAEVLASKLLGRGGAAFPTGRKMEAVARAARGRTTSSATPTNRSPARSRIAC